MTGALSSRAKADTASSLHGLMRLKEPNARLFCRVQLAAIARIATDESRLALEQMSKSSDPHLHGYGLEGLEHWLLPFKRC